MDEDNAITQVIDLLGGENVEYILVGGAAVILHGSAYVTEDIDVCCRRSTENMERIARALNRVNPRFRVDGVPEGVATTLDVRLLRAGDAFAFITAIGYLDIRFTIDGIGSYDEVLRLSDSVQIGTRIFLLLSLDGIIQSKSFLRRPRDLQLLPELEMMREAQSVQEGRDASN